LIGRLFKAFINEEINYDNFLRTVSCIEKVHLPDLKDFITATWKDLTIDDGGADYLASGLMEIDPIAPKVILDEQNSRPWDNEFIYTIENGTLNCSLTHAGMLIRKILYS
jgi:hypothetical protein